MQYYNFQKMSIEKEGSLENHTGTRKNMKLRYRAFQTIQMKNFEWAEWAILIFYLAIIFAMFIENLWWHYSTFFAQ